VHEDHKTRTTLLSIITYILTPLLIIIPNSVITDWQLHALAVLIPTILAPLWALLVDCFLARPKHTHKYAMTAVYSYLWGAHFYIAKQLLIHNYITSPVYIAILILSIITLLTSSSTICFSPVR